MPDDFETEIGDHENVIVYTNSTHGDPYLKAACQDCERHRNASAREDALRRLGDVPCDE